MVSSPLLAPLGILPPGSNVETSNNTTSELSIKNQGHTKRTCLQMSDPSLDCSSRPPKQLITLNKKLLRVLSFRLRFTTFLFLDVGTIVDGKGFAVANCIAKHIRFRQICLCACRRGLLNKLCFLCSFLICCVGHCFGAADDGGIVITATCY